MGHGCRLELGVDWVLCHLFLALSLVEIFLENLISASKHVDPTLESEGLVLLLVISNPIENREHGCER